MYLRFHWHEATRSLTKILMINRLVAKLRSVSSYLRVRQRASAGTTSG